jgi:hypothetical protein
MSPRIIHFSGSSALWAPPVIDPSASQCLDIFVIDISIVYRIQATRPLTKSQAVKQSTSLGATTFHLQINNTALRGESSKYDSTTHIPTLSQAHRPVFLNSRVPICQQTWRHKVQSSTLIMARPSSTEDALGTTTAAFAVA